MSRNTNRRISHGGSTMASSLMAVDRIIHKERSYREAININQATAVALAESIAIGGDVERSVLQVAENDDALKQDFQTLFQEERERLKKLAEKNVQNSRNVDAFLGALHGVRTQVLQLQQQQRQEEGDADTTDPEPLDYEQIINEKMQQYRDAQKTQELDMKDEQLCRDIRSALGEKEAARNGEEDDELEVLGGKTASLKCPIMGTLFEDPVKNKVCGHTYSRAGILSHIRASRGRNASCPVAGCRNGNVTQEQLEDDHSAGMKVRQRLRREANEREQRMSQTILDDDEEK